MPHILTNHHMEIEVAFAQILREIRKSSGLSQEQLALLAGLDRTFVSLLEREQRQPTLKSIFQLSKALEIAPDELVRRVDEVYRENSKN